MFRVSSRGNFEKTYKFLRNATSGDIYNALDAAGRRGVEALSANTPVASGATARAWGYKVTKNNRTARVDWYNTHQNKGVNIAIILQYGHATGTGGYVTGIDYINPAMRPIFDQIAEDVWKKVKNG